MTKRQGHKIPPVSRPSRHESSGPCDMDPSLSVHSLKFDLLAHLFTLFLEVEASIAEFPTFVNRAGP